MFAASSSPDLLTILQCPVCGAPLAAAARGVRCSSCERQFHAPNGIIDLIDDEHPSSGISQSIMSSPLFARAYERLWRPSLFRISTAFRMPALSHERALIADALGGAKGPSLDLSCGPGTFTETLCALNSRTGVVAVDISRPMLELTRRRVPAALLIRAAAERLPFADAAFAAACNMAALDVYRDPAHALVELSRVLRAGAPFLLSTFVWPTALASFDRVRNLLAQAGASHAPLRDELAAMLTGAGLQIDQLSSFGSYVIVRGLKKERSC